MQTATCKIDIGRLEGQENWTTWRYKVTHLLRGSAGGLDAVEGKLKKPVHPGEHATSEQLMKYREELQKYNQIDSNALLLLTANMSDHTLQKVMRLETSKEVWDELHRLFDRSSDDKTYTYSLDFFHYCKDPLHDMATHISKIKNLWHNLKIELMKECKCDLPEVLLICKILDTVPDNFFPFKSSWLLLSKEDRNIENLTTQLCNFEKSLFTHNNTGCSEAAFATQNSKDKFIKKKCSYCGKLGHKIKTCQKWISDGKPPKPSTSQANSKVNAVLMEIESNQVAHAVIESDTESWYVDNGATNHVTNRRDFFSNFESFTGNNTLTTANGATINALGKGNIHLVANLQNRKQDIILNDVWYVPTIKKNLFSVLAAQDKILNSVFISERETCFLKANGQILLMGKRSKNGGLYKINAKTILADKSPTNSEINALSNLQLYHERFAHQNKRHVKKIIENKLGIKVPLDSELCTGCIYGKTHRKQFGTRAKTEAPGEIFHTDVCGPFPCSFSKYKYFVLFKDDFSKYRFVYFLKHKNEVCEKLKQVLQECERAGHCIKEVLSDNGGEFDNEQVRNLLQQAGIKQRLTMPYTPQQNGTSERDNRTLVEAARSMMHCHEELPVSCWSELISTAAYVLNRTGPTSIDGKSPFELWFNKKPSIKHLRVIGCECYAHVPKQKRTKLSKKAQKCVLIGYEGDDGYRLLNFDKYGKPTLVRSRDVTFNESIIESVGLEKEDYDETETEIHLKFPLVKQNPQMSEAREEVQEEVQIETEDVHQPADMPQTFEIPDSSNRLDQFTGNQSEPSSPLSYDTPYQSEEHSDDETVIEENVDMNLRDRSLLRKPLRFDDFIMNVSSYIEPKTYKEALKSPQKGEWCKAMDSEVKSLIETKTWTLVDLPKGRKPISCKWVYRVKTIADGTLDRFKARLVARGYTQREGIDYFETFSPVAKLATVRLILNIAVNEDLILTQFDVATAFLNGSLDEEIYMNQPEGYSDGSKKVCKLKRSLYGLKQAPRCWNRCIVDYLKSIGFKQCDNDPCLFVRIRQNRKIIVALYVDDGLVASTDPKESERFMNELMKRFKIAPKPASYYLGLEILKQENGSLKLTQRHYTEKLLKRFGMYECKSVNTPIVKDGTQTDSNEGTAEFPYREAVGALNYLMTGSRPDIAYAMSVVSRNLESPTREDVIKVKRIFTGISFSLKGTVDYVVIYKKGDKSLLCYSDSDHGGDVTTGRSTSGILCTYAQGVISWASRRQTCVAISSTEAELVAASETAREIMWLKRLINEISDMKETPMLLVDNEAAIKISQNPELHRRTKHIALRHFYIRELVTDKEVEVKYVPTEYQCADILTKSVCKPRLLLILDKLGIQ